MENKEKIGEVIEACTTDFIAQCYELYETPPLGSLVKTGGGADSDIYGVVYNVLTTGIEPGRRPIARGKNELTEEEVYRSSPQLYKLLKSEFHALVIGYRHENHIFQFLPANPARIHSFVHFCTAEEVKKYSQTFNFLNILLKARLDIPVEELAGACLRQMSLVYGPERSTFLISAGKELATLLNRDYGQLKAILKGLKYDAAK
jgi:hypothetical protein